jgi:hypothetical protein
MKRNRPWPIYHVRTIGEETSRVLRDRIGMGQFVFGAFAGIVMCSVILMVRCVLWYEKRHPEDDYWHRLTSDEEKDKGGG